MHDEGTLSGTEQQDDPLSGKHLGDAAVLWSQIMPVLPLYEVQDGVCGCPKGTDCPSPGKHPRIYGGLSAASQDEDQIRRWWAEWPESNIGGVTGHGVHVVDVDGPEGETNLLPWQLPETMEVRTGKGRHLYFKEPDGFRAGNTQGGSGARHLGLSIDTRGLGGYVVLPPSRHALGHTYRLIDRDLAPLPANLIERLRSTSDSTPDLPLDVPHRAATPTANSQFSQILTVTVERIRAASKGSRHNRILTGIRHVAGYYHLQDGMTAEEVLQYLDEAVECAYTGEDSTSGKRTARDAWRHGLHSPYSHMPGQLQMTPDGRPYVVAVDGKDGMFVATSGEEGGGEGQPTYVFQVKNHVVPRLLREWPGLPLFVPKASGDGVRRMTSVEALEAFGDSWAGEVRYTYVGVSRFDPDTRSLIIAATFRPKPKAVYHEEIAEWLRCLVSEHDRKDLLGWLATYPLLDRPTAGLVLTGEQGAGKGLLAEGLAAYFGTPPVKYEDAVGYFNGNLTASPLVWLDEETSATGASGPFRSLLANSTHRIRIMYQPPGVLYGSPRLLVCANEPDPLGLAHDELSTQSELAIGRRLRHMTVLPAAREYLESLPTGYTYENRWPERIAEHIEWLRTNEGVERGKRLLVEGEGHRWVRDVSTQVGLAGQLREILEDLVIAAEDEAPLDVREMRCDKMSRAGLDNQVLLWSPEQPDHVLVSNKALRARWDQLAGETRAPTHVAIGRALKKMAGRDALQVRFSAGRVRVIPIPLSLLRQDAAE